MNRNTQLYRQIHPVFIKQEYVSFEAFIPTSKDDGLLSVFDGDKVSPEDSWRRFKEKWNSSGVLAVTVEECNSEDLETRDDPTEDFPEHIVIDFTKNSKTHEDNSKRERKNKAMHLREYAINRGWLYRQG